MANRLRIAKVEQVISCLTEGCSIRSTERLTGVHRDTIMRVLNRVGAACEVLMDERMRGLTCRHVQVDELWTFVGRKQRRLRPQDSRITMGDFWCFIALDQDTKLVPAYGVSKRNAWTTSKFIRDLAPRFVNRVQLSTDQLKYYVNAVEDGFGGNVDYAMVAKAYVAEAAGPGRYGPPRVSSVDKKWVQGRPDLSVAGTSHVECQNRTVRMSVRRFTRLTNAFSRKVENLKAACALHFVSYNFCRRHSSLRMSPAMAAGVSDKLWNVGDIAALSE